jgi:glycosyltransferase involved in cell wall biosynthesis
MPASIRPSEQVSSQKRPLRVRMIHTRYPHFGAHAGMFQLAKFLAPARVKVDLVSVSDSDEDLPFRNTRIRERLHRMIRARGVAWYKLSDFYAEWQAAQASMLFRMDVVHYIDGEHSASLLPGLLQRLRVLPTRTIATFHQPWTLLGELLNPLILQQLDLITVVSPDQAEWFRAAAPWTRVETVLHGVDTDFFSPGERSHSDHVFRCITCGHWLRDWKAVRAVAERLSDHRRIEFHIVTSRETGLEGLPNVLFYRGIDDHTLRALYRSSDALFLPLTDSTANNTLLEGIACGLPVVSTILPGVRAYLSGNEGFLIERNEPDQLTDALLTLRRDVDLRVAMSARARERAEQLSWHSIARQWEALYQEVCA